VDGRLADARSLVSTMSADATRLASGHDAGSAVASSSPAITSTE